MADTQDTKAPLTVQDGPANRGWHDVLGRALFEILIVAVGVMLALAADGWRERSQQRQLADEAREALRNEIILNREAIYSRLRRTSKLYIMAARHPERVAQYVVERRNRPLLITEAAWTLTVQTAAIRWLDHEERAKIAQLYAAYDRAGDLVTEEMIRWTELAAFSSTAGSAELQGDRDRAIQVWQAFAQRVQLSLCINAGRHEQALGGTIDEPQMTDSCVNMRPEEDPATIYAKWKRRGWVSPIPPRAIFAAVVEP